MRINFCPVCGEQLNTEVPGFKWHTLPCGHTVQLPFSFLNWRHRPHGDFNHIFCYQCGEVIKIAGRKRTVLVDRCPDCQKQSEVLAALPGKKATV